MLKENVNMCKKIYIQNTIKYRKYLFTIYVEGLYF